MSLIKSWVRLVVVVSIAVAVHVPLKPPFINAKKVLGRAIVFALDSASAFNAPFAPRQLQLRRKGIARASVDARGLKASDTVKAWPRVPALANLVIVNSTDHRLVPSTRVRYISRVMYDGTDFMGFQFQPHKRTVQGELEKALALIHQDDIKVRAASRTDTGVHAVGQCVHFDVPKNPDSPGEGKLPPAQLEFKMNRVLPHDIRVYNVALASATEHALPWHSRIMAVGKLYTYHFTVSEHQSPLRRHYQTHYRKGQPFYYGQMDLSRLQAAFPLFRGTHDFTSFVNNKAFKDPDQSEAALNPNRTISRLELHPDGGSGEWRLEFEINGALYRMIRNIVGTLWAVGGGFLTHDDIADIFERRDRGLNPAKTAPAKGLTLTKVYYDDYD